MFKKLVSNLPFNPSLIQQISFYSKRLQREQSFRRLSFLFMAATLVVNIVAISAPAQNTLATSLNDVVYGARSKQTVINSYKNNRDGAGRTDIQAIFNYYGITENDIANASQVRINSKDRNYMSTGRWESPGDDDPQMIPGASTTIYERFLKVWDIRNPSNTYDAITGTATGSGKISGKQFWILLDGCGNIVYIPEPKTPNIEIKKTRLSSDKLRVGENASYRIDYRNSGTAAAEWVVIEDTLEPEFAYVGATKQPFEIRGQQLIWFIGILAPSSEYHQITITVQLKQISEASKRVCNFAVLKTSNAGEVRSADACIIIDNSCPGSGLPAPDGDLSKCEITCPDGTKLPYNQIDSCPVPVVACEKLQLISTPDWNQRTVRLTTKRSAGSEINKISFLANNKTVSTINSPGAEEEFTYKDLSEGNYVFSVNYDIKTGQLQTSSSCVVEEKIEQPVPSISATKKVRNITKKINDAEGTTASGGDVIEYSVITTNSGTGAANGYIVKPDSLGRVLEYADLHEYTGATFDRTSQQISWPAVNIKPGESVTSVFSVKIKNPVPATAPSLSDPAGKQYVICNRYGNEVCVDIARPLPAVVQNNVERLPNTGPGASMVITFISVLVLGYFYLRSRVLGRELEVIKYDYSHGE